METKYLKDIGLNENEIRLYLELLKQEECLASEVAKNTGINRTLTYTLLDNLCRRGMVSYVIKNNIKYFKAGHPEKIINFLKEKEANINTIIPELLKLKNPSKKSYSVELYEGKEGLKTALEDVLRVKPKLFLDMTSGMTPIVLPRYWMDQWHRKRIATITFSRFLYNNTPLGRNRAKDFKNMPKTETRILPSGLKSFSHIYTYSDRVTITLWEKEFPFAIVIRSKEIAVRFKEFFEWFWKQGKPI